jgi:hypothetical protein
VFYKTGILFSVSIMIGPEIGTGSHSQAAAFMTMAMAGFRRSAARHKLTAYLPVPAIEVVMNSATL